MIPSLARAAGSSSPAEGAASCPGSAGERGRAGGYCPRREDGGGWRGAVNAAGCAVSAAGAEKGRGRGAAPGPAPPREAGRAASSAGRRGWERVLGGGVWKPPPQAAACDDPGGKEKEEAGGDRLSE